MTLGRDRSDREAHLNALFTSLSLTMNGLCGLTRSEEITRDHDDIDLGLIGGDTPLKCYLRSIRKTTRSVADHLLAHRGLVMLLPALRFVLSKRKSKGSEDAPARSSSHRNAHLL